MGTLYPCGEGLRSDPGDQDLLRRGLRVRLCGLVRLCVDFLDEVLQLDGALLAHLLADVTVDVQREGRRGVAEVFLEGFDIHSAFQTDHRVGVPQVVDSGLRRADLRRQPLEAVVDGPVGQIPAEGAGEYQAGFGPLVPQEAPQLVLPRPLLSEKLGNTGRHGNDAAFVVLRRDDLRYAALGVLLVELLLDQDRAACVVYTIPGQPQKLPFPHPGEQGDLVEVFVGMSRQQLQQIGDLLRGQRVDFLFDDPGQNAAVRGIRPEQSDLHGLLQGAVEDAVNVFDGFCADGASVGVRRLDQLVVKLLHHGARQLVQPDGADVRNDIEPDRLAVEQGGGILDAQKVVLRPGFQPLGDGLIAGRDVGPGVAFRERFRQLLLDDLTGGSGDGALDHFSGFGISPVGKAGFPVGSHRTVLAFDAFLADAAAAIGAFLSAWHNDKYSFLFHTERICPYYTICVMLCQFPASYVNKKFTNTRLKKCVR